MPAGRSGREETLQIESMMNVFWKIYLDEPRHTLSRSLVSKKININQMNERTTMQAREQERFA